MRRIPDADLACNLVAKNREYAKQIRGATKYYNKRFRVGHGDDGWVISHRLNVQCRVVRDAGGNLVEKIGIDAKAIHYHAHTIRPTVRRCKRKICRGPLADLSFVETHRTYQRRYQTALRCYARWAQEASDDNN